MPDALSAISTRETPQTESARADQVENSAGGFVFQVDALARAARFLILGTDGGTYYASEQKLTKESAAFVLELANGPRAREFLELVLDVSLRGRAARQSATLFSLAALTTAADVEVRRDAAAAIPAVCRTGTMLFQFVGYAENLRGWGRVLVRGVGRWYSEQDPERLAYGTTKYRQRDGWSHRDLLRLARPAAPSAEHSAIYDFVRQYGRVEDYDPAPTLPVLQAFYDAQRTTDPAIWAQLVEAYGLSWEHLPDAALGYLEVWDALVPKLGLTALVRNLARLTSLGYLRPFDVRTEAVVARLGDLEAIRKSRIHPMAALLALGTYQTGRGLRGGLAWVPVPAVCEALEGLFHAAFVNVEPTGRRFLLGLDVSGSMGSPFAGSVLTCVEAEMALATVFLQTEANVLAMGFSGGFVPLGFSRTTSIREAVLTAQRMPFQTTDCSLPMLYALENGIDVDVFVVVTDNETYAGRTHPFQALRAYRERTGIPARLAVLAMTATDFSIADPSDAGMIDLVGFDTSTPSILGEFAAGRI